MIDVHMNKTVCDFVERMNDDRGPSARPIELRRRLSANQSAREVVRPTRAGLCRNDLGTYL